MVLGQMASRGRDESLDRKKNTWGNPKVLPVRGFRHTPLIFLSLLFWISLLFSLQGIPSLLI